MKAKGSILSGSLSYKYLELGNQLKIDTVRCSYFYALLFLISLFIAFFYIILKPAELATCWESRPAAASAVDQQLASIARIQS